MISKHTDQQIWIGMLTCSCDMHHRHRAPDSRRFSTCSTSDKRNIATSCCRCTTKGQPRAVSWHHENLCRSAKGYASQMGNTVYMTLWCYRVSHQCSAGRYIRTLELGNGGSYARKLDAKTWIANLAYLEWAISHSPFYYSCRAKTVSDNINDRAKVSIVRWYP